MHSVVIVILLADVSQPHSKELPSNQTTNENYSVDKLMKKSTNTLLDELFDRALESRSLHHACLDATILVKTRPKTFVKIHLDKSHGTPWTKSSSIVPRGPFLVPCLPLTIAPHSMPASPAQFALASVSACRRPPLVPFSSLMKSRNCVMTAAKTDSADAATAKATAEEAGITAKAAATEPTTSFTLRVPSSRIESAAWIRRQVPETVADALAICELSLQAVQREVSEGEASRLAAEAHMLKREVESVKNQHKQDLADLVEATQKKTEQKFLSQKDQLLKDFEDEKSLLERELDARKQAYTAMVQRLQEENKQVEEKLLSVRGRVQEEFRALNDKEISELRLTQEKQLVCLKQLADGEATVLKGKMKELADELALIRSKEKAERAEVLEHLRQAQEQKISQLMQEHAIRVQGLERQLVQRDEKDAKQFEWFRQELENNREQLRTALEEKQKSVEESKAQILQVWEENKSFMANLRGSSSQIGQIGEHFVEQIFADLNLGSWVDTRGEGGFGDALWEWSQSETLLRCLVEVKMVKYVSSQKDIGKFWSNLDTSLRAERINAGMLLSLSARIPDTRQLDIRIYNGVPVIQASRAADDVVPASTLVEMAFYAFCQIWPVLSRNNEKQDDLEGMLHSIAVQFDLQLREIAKLSKRIENIEKTGITLQKEAAAMRKIRDTMVGSMDQIRLQYPQLNAGTELSLRGADQVKISTNSKGSGKRRGR